MEVWSKSASGQAAIDCEAYIQQGREAENPAPFKNDVL
jgi:hypothetical protein